MHGQSLRTLPLSCSFVLLIAHLSVLKRVVDIKRGILLAGSVLDHSWVLRAETWLSGHSGPREFLGTSRNCS